MLTCFSGTTHEVFRKILTFFVKEGSVILDLTYGRGLSWRSIKKEKYKIIKVDKRKLFKDVIKADLNDFLMKKRSESVDCIYFDPPYYFKEKIGSFDIKNQMLNNENEVFWTEGEFLKALQTLRNHAPRVLVNGGYLIVKIMDGYIGKKYYPLAFKIFEEMSKVMVPKGIFICPINKKDKIQNLIRINFIYYLVFQKN